MDMDQPTSPKPDLLSFIVLLSIAACTVLTVLTVAAKREVSELRGKGDDREDKVAVVSASPTPYPTTAPRTYESLITLPKANLTGKLPLESAIQARRSRREFSDKKVTLAEISQMLWAGQGITEPITGKRTAPSARESYSMTLFVFVKVPGDLEPGLYEYLPKEHALGKMRLASVEGVMKSAGVQPGAIDAPVVFLVTSSFGNYEVKTKSHNVTATYMEAGHIGQNMYLQAESLGMGTVTMAGFDNTKVTTALAMDPTLTVEYILPFGHRAPEKAAIEAKE
jgi:SagB-type dehydrogenase family enzyme